MSTYPLHRPSAPPEQQPRGRWVWVPDAPKPPPPLPLLLAMPSATPAADAAFTEPAAGDLLSGTGTWTASRQSAILENAAALLFDETATLPLPTTCGQGDQFAAVVWDMAAAPSCYKDDAYSCHRNDAYSCNPPWPGDHETAALAFAVPPLDEQFAQAMWEAQAGGAVGTTAPTTAATMTTANTTPLMPDHFDLDGLDLDLELELDLDPGFDQYPSLGLDLAVPPAATATTTASSDSSTSSSPPSAATSLTCPTCGRGFASPHQLRKHSRKHSRPFVCSVCAKGHAAKKDLHRHLWAKHADEAARAEIPRDVRPCPMPGCRIVCRQDNLLRHLRNKHKYDGGGGPPPPPP